MIWIRVSLLKGSDELRSTLMRLPPKRRLRRLLLLIYAARQPGGWPPGDFEVSETPEVHVEDTTLRARLDEDCEELEAHLRAFPRGLRSGRLLVLAEHGMRVLRGDADCAPVRNPPKPTSRRSPEGKASVVALREGSDLPGGAGSRVQRAAACVDGFNDDNDDALDFALNAFLGFE